MASKVDNRWGYTPTLIMLYVICYDFPATKDGNRRRSRMVKYLEGQGDRVQYSVFEVRWNSAKERDAAIRRIRSLMEITKDQLRIYAIPDAAVEQIMLLGEGKIYEIENTIIL